MNKLSEILLEKILAEMSKPKLKDMIHDLRTTDDEDEQDQIRSDIKKHHGEKGLDAADDAEQVQTYGRGKSNLGKTPKIGSIDDKPIDKKTTKAGKLTKASAQALKSRIKSRLVKDSFDDEQLDAILEAVLAEMDFILEDDSDNEINEGHYDREWYKKTADSHKRLAVNINKHIKTAKSNEERASLMKVRDSVVASANAHATAAKSYNSGNNATTKKLSDEADRAAREASSHAQEHGKKFGDYSAYNSI